MINQFSILLTFLHVMTFLIVTRAMSAASLLRRLLLLRGLPSRVSIVPLAGRMPLALRLVVVPLQSENRKFFGGT